MRKFATTFLLATMMLGLASCGSNQKAEETTEESSTFALDAAEYVELGTYTNLTIEGAKVEVTDEDIDMELNDLCYQYASYEKISREEVQEEDIVNIDYTCVIDGEEVEDYCEEGYDLSLGTGELTFGEDLDLEAEMIGKKVGDVLEMKGVIEEDYLDEMLAGKQAEFTVKINYVAEEVIPELNDAFIQKNFDETSVAEYRETLRAELEEQAALDVEEQNQAALWEKAVENAKQIKDFPKDALEEEKELAIAQEEEWAAYFGIEIGEDTDAYFQETYGMTLEEYAVDALKRECVLDLIIQKENLTATEEEINAMLENEMEQSGYESIEEVLEFISKEDVASQILFDKAMEIVQAGATIQ